MNKHFSFVQRGSSMIEVMIALFVMAVGLLGVLAMQVNAIQVSKNASLYSQAAILGNGIIEAMRTTPTAGGAYLLNFDESTPAKPGCTTSGTDCDPDQIAKWNVYQWRTSIESSLPAGASEIQRIGEEFTVRIRFQVGFDEDTNQAITDQIELTTVL